MRCYVFLGDESLRDVITIHLNGSRLTGLTCSKAPGFWMVEHQLVLNDFDEFDKIEYLFISEVLFEKFIKTCTETAPWTKHRFLTIFNDGLKNRFVLKV